MKGVPGFLGVFSMDTLPTRKLKDGDSLIVNMRPSNMTGSHWVCLYCDTEYILYLDSFGLPPHETIRKYETKNKPIVYNSSELQHPDSLRCGEYCVYFLKELSLGVPIYSVLYKLDQHPSMHNEKLIDAFYNKK
jgi:hypothetical protein